jgi:hypothetical protein
MRNFCVLIVCQFLSQIALSQSLSTANKGRFESRNLVVLNVATVYGQISYVMNSQQPSQNEQSKMSAAKLKIVMVPGSDAINDDFVQSNIRIIADPDKIDEVFSSMGASPHISYTDENGNYNFNNVRKGNTYFIIFCRNRTKVKITLSANSSNYLYVPTQYIRAN